jgi:1-Cys peroxiredoxin 6
MPGLTIGDTVPNLELDSTHGKIRIHDYVGNGYVILFSHPGMCKSRTFPRCSCA